MRLVIHYLSLFALLGTTAWLVSARDWEQAVAFVAALATFLGSDLLGTVKSRQDSDTSASIEAFAQIHQAFAKYSNMIDTGKLLVSKAELIQHSSERASNFVLVLARAGADIDLFLQNPETAKKLNPPLFVSGIEKRIGGYQRPLERINYKREFKLYLYETPASVNGIRLKIPNGEVILILGWYAYYHKGAMTDLTQSQVGGGENPCIVINSAHREFERFNEFFEDLLNTYRNQTDAPEVHINAGRTLRERLD